MSVGTYVELQRIADYMRQLVDQMKVLNSHLETIASPPANNITFHYPDKGYQTVNLTTSVQKQVKE